jgi:hypothetical protein
MILFTKKSDIYGNFSFGLDLESLLFKKNLSAKKIEQELLHQIRAFCPEYQTYKTDVDVVFYKYPNREETQINISIENIRVITIQT